jgi:uncharacterized FlaG/YvyC family protein
MGAIPISPTLGGASAINDTGNTSQSQLKDAVTAARKLNNLDVTGREFSVIRDPTSQRFVVVVLDRSTGTVVDQYPPEEVLRLLAQLGSSQAKETGESSS